MKGVDTVKHQNPDLGLSDQKPLRPANFRNITESNILILYSVIVRLPTDSRYPQLYMVDCVGYVHVVTFTLFLVFLCCTVPNGFRFFLSMLFKYNIILRVKTFY